MDKAKSAAHSAIIGWGNCNRTLSGCELNRSYGCEVDREACRRLQDDLGSCRRGWLAKNSSYSSLKSDCDDLNESWEDATTDLEACRTEKTELGKLYNSTLVSIVISTANFTKSLSQCKFELLKQQNDSHELRAVLDVVHDDLKCLDGTPNCSYEAGKYMCLPRIYYPHLCSTKAQVGQNVFGISLCNLVGDLTISTLDWTAFIRINPKVAILLILLFIFACIGMVSSFVLILWCVVVCRIKRRSYQVHRRVRQDTSANPTTSTTPVAKVIVKGVFNNSCFN